MVLDPFAGSGTTIVAAIEEGMGGVGIEREEKFYRIAVRRVGKTLELTQDRLDKEEAGNLMYLLESE